MAKVRDHRSFHGNTGALTVVADVYSVFAPTFWPRFFFFRYIFRAPYKQVEGLKALFAFRWSLVRFPGSAKKTLIFETVFYGDWSQYLRVLVAGAGGGVDAHAFGSIGYPTVENVDVFLNYLNQHHRPAIHVFAKNPNTSPMKIPKPATSSSWPRSESWSNRKQPTRWFGAIFEIRSGFVGQVTDILEAWNSIGPKSSPFEIPEIQHGRAVIVQHNEKSFLLVSTVYRIAPDGFKPKALALAKPSREFLNKLLDKGPNWNTWRDLLQMTMAVTKEKDQTIRTTEAMIQIVLNAEFGSQRIGFWVTNGWGSAPFDETENPK